MSYQTILFDQREGVATITLNRPEVLNACNRQLMEELAAALKTCERDPAIRCVLLTGAGRAFCSGQDLRVLGELAGEQGRPPVAEHLRRLYNPVILRMREMEKPILAAVNGVAAGAGMSLALACDLRIAAESATFIQAFVRIGLVPDTGSTYFLARIVGLGRAFELAVSGRRVSAQEALELGLVNRVVPDDRLAEEAMAWAQELAQGPTRAIGLTKRALNRALLLDVDEMLDYEAQLQQIAAGTADSAEGIRAFLEKRRPSFVGR